MKIVTIYFPFGNVVAEQYAGKVASDINGRLACQGVTAIVLPDGCKVQLDSVPEGEAGKQEPK